MIETTAERPASSSAWSAGSDAPELAEIKLGFMALTDCAPLVMARVLGLDQKYGLRFQLCKETSWTALRDKMVAGECQIAQMPYGMVYSTHLGVGGPQKDLALLMTLSHNGQAISLANALRENRTTTGHALARLIAKRERGFTFAHSYPTGTHAMWLYFWLATYGIDPLKDIKTIVVPPAKMAEHLQMGYMDGACMGEPWNQRIIAEGLGFTVATSQSIWPDHPEKALAVSAEFAARYPRTIHAMLCAILEASRWMEASALNLSKTAEVIAGKAFVNASTDVIRSRLIGQYENGLGKRWVDQHGIQFHQEGAVNFPYLSDGMWFLTQFKRWGLLKGEIDYHAIAQGLHRLDLYRQAAQTLNISLPEQDMRSTVLMDGVRWDGQDPAGYVQQFAIHA